MASADARFADPVTAFGMNAVELFLHPWEFGTRRAEELLFTGGFTRLADRLERRGLIERRRSADDGRGFVAVLTREGRVLLRKAWRQQYSDLHRLFFDRLDDDHLRGLADVWARLGADDGDESKERSR